MGKIRPFKKGAAGEDYLKKAVDEARDTLVQPHPASARAPGKPLRVLVVEDSEEDTILLVNALQQGGYEPSFVRVDTPEAMADALAGQEWDVVLADYMMPRFSGLAALVMLKEKGADIPFIMVSGKIGEDALVEAMKAGAHDYIVKDNLSKVVPAIERELEDLAARKGKKRAEAQVKRQSSLLYAINKLLIEALSCTTCGDVARVCLSAARDLTGSSAGLICEINASGGLDAIATSGTVRGACAAITPDNAELGGIYVQAVESGESVICGGLAGHTPITTLMAVPLKTGGKVAWLIGLAGKEHGYTVEDREGVEMLSVAFMEALTHKRMERALEKSEKRFRDLVETSSDWIWEVDENGVYTYVSPKVRDILGYEPEEVLGKAPWDLMPKDEVARVYGLFEPALKERRPYNLLENVFIHKDGHEVMIETSGTPFFDQDGIFRGYKGIDRDITDRKQTQKNLAAMNRLNSVLSGINKMIIRTKDKQTLFLECCRTAVERGSFMFAWVGLMDKDTLIRPAAHWGHEEGYLDKISISAGGGQDCCEPTGSALGKGEHFICTDVENDPRFLPWREEALKRGYRSCATFPISAGVRTIGAISVYSDKTGFFDDDEIALLDELADDISFGIQTIELEGQQKRAEEALKNEIAVSEALLRTAEVTTASLNWDSIAESVLGLLKQLTSCDSAAVIMLDDDRALMPHKTVGASSTLQSFFYTNHAKLSEIEALEHIVATKKSLTIKKEELCFVMPELFTKNLELKNLIIAPIIARDKVSGFLGTNFDRLPADPRVTAIIQGMAGQLGAAYESAGLYEETQRKSLDLARKMEALKVLHEIDRMILSTLDRDEMLSRVVLQIKRLLPADTGYVAMLDPEKKGLLTYRCGWGMKARKGEAIPVKGTPGYNTVKSGKALFRANIFEEGGQSSMDRAFRDLGIRSDMFVPIFSKGTGIGVIRLGSSRVAGFSLDDVATAEKLAYQIGIAWENSRLIADLEDMLLNTVKAMSSAIDAKSPWTKGHSERVTDYAVRIAGRLGLCEAELEKIRLAGLLHDVGKIGTYDTILDKPDRLTDEEFELVKKHPDRGCEILAPIKQFKDILPAIRYHHERWDGRGYPAGLRGEEIPLPARILCVADSFDSMTADRPYRPSPGREYAVTEFRRCSGTQFDPRVIEAFLNVIGE